MAGRGRARVLAENRKIIVQEELETIPVFKHDINNNIMKNQFQNVDYDDDLCRVCDRPDVIVFCRNCGHEWKGRKKISCPSHPKTIMLMDSVVCPVTGCNSLDLKEI